MVKCASNERLSLKLFEYKSYAVIVNGDDKKKCGKAINTTYIDCRIYFEMYVYGYDKVQASTVLEGNRNFLCIQLFFNAKYSKIRDIDTMKI